MAKFVDFLISVFYPNKCVFCGEDLEYDKIMCDECSKNIKRLNPNICSCCKKEKCCCENDIEKIISMYYYGMGVDTAIQSLKFNAVTSNAKKLAVLLKDFLSDSEFLKDVDVIIPVPMYVDDKQKRGFNQSEKIAEYLCEMLKIKLDETSLKKIRKTKSQHNLSETERKINLVNSYNATGNSLVGKTVLLLDDVCTTGSTLSECAKELKRIKAGNIYAVTVAKTV